MNSKGNAIIIVLILIASVMTTSAIVMQSSTSLSQTYSQKSSAQVADNISQIISSLMSDPGVCLNGVDGSGAEPGIQFLNGSGAPSTFSPSMSSGSNTQNVSLPSHYLNPSTGLHHRLQAGFPIPNTDLRIERLYVTDSSENPAGSGAYRMKLMAQLTVAPAGVPVRNLNVRQVMKLGIQLSGTTVISCGAAPTDDSNVSLCEGMNCTYTPDPGGGAGNCFCPIQPVNCINGTYVASIVNYVPQCSSNAIERVCDPGQFLVALDSGGNKVCAQVESCPTGTSITGAGGAANPPECKCASAGYTWNSGTNTCDAPLASPPPPPPPPAMACAESGSAGIWTTASGATSGLTTRLGPLAWNNPLVKWTEWNSGTSPAHALSGRACATIGNYCDDMISPPLASDVSVYVKCSPGAPPPPSPCPPGASAAGAGVVINASCRCNSTNDVWDGSTCSPYVSYCHYVFSNGSILANVCAEGDPISAEGGGSCTAAARRYIDSSRPDRICNGFNVFACANCGPGSNIPAGICTVDPNCSGGPPSPPPSGASCSGGARAICKPRSPGLEAATLETCSPSASGNYASLSIDCNKASAPTPGLGFDEHCMTCPAGPPLSDPCATPGACRWRNPIYEDSGCSDSTPCASINPYGTCSTLGAETLRCCDLARYRFTCGP